MTSSQHFLLFCLLTFGFMCLRGAYPRLAPPLTPWTSIIYRQPLRHFPKNLDWIKMKSNYDKADVFLDFIQIFCLKLIWNKDNKTWTDLLGILPRHNCWKLCQRLASAGWNHNSAGSQRLLVNFLTWAYLGGKRGLATYNVKTNSYILDIPLIG